MKSLNSSEGSSSISILTLLTAIFVTLKLLDKIDWSWWAVLAPTWIPLSGALGFFLFAGLLVAVAAAKR